MIVLKTWRPNVLQEPDSRIPLISHSKGKQVEIQKHDTPLQTFPHFKTSFSILLKNFFSSFTLRNSIASNLTIVIRQKEIFSRIFSPNFSNETITFVISKIKRNESIMLLTYPRLIPMFLFFGSIGSDRSIYRACRRRKRDHPINEIHPRKRRRRRVSGSAFKLRFGPEIMYERADTRA